ncbi:MAG TPA: efflux RND transporter periplasmic adaptor subunit [Steroidobacteraceae bacterium]|nr:efflux RND transporter periplasmic adaptor subunit [Steroidobacteraceae bacterium]
MAVIALALASAGCSRAAGQAAAPAPAPPGSFHLSDEQLSSLQIERVSSRPFHSQIIVDGKIAYDADTLTPVYSPFSGRVTQLVAPLGASVRQGAVLFRLQAAESAQGASDLVTAQTQVRLNTTLEQRKHAQYLSHGASLQDWQQAQSELAQSRSTLAAARNRLRILGESDAQIDAIAAAGADFRADATAVAPISGTVVDRQIGPGQYLQAGSSTPVYTVANLSRVWLVAEVPETEAPAVHVGQDVTAEVVGLPDHPYHARLSYVAAAVDAATRRLTVHAELNNPDGMLRPEMFATLTIVTSADSAAPAVPEQAVVYQGTQARVWVLQDANDAALRIVQLGRTLDGNIEVLGGLREGEQVITRGALFIDRAASGD